MALLMKKESAEPEVLDDVETPGVFRAIVICLVPGLVLWALIIWGVLALVGRLT